MAKVKDVEPDESDALRASQSISRLQTVTDESETTSARYLPFWA